MRTWLGQPYRPRQRARRKSKLDPFKGQIMGWLRQHRYSAVQILDLLREQGFDGGIIATGLVPGGPAEKVGFERGDLILSLDGRTVSTLRELYSEIWKRAPGDRLSLQILRNSAIRRIEIVAGDRYEFFK